MNCLLLRIISRNETLLFVPRRTDRILIARLRLHSMQHGKNETLLFVPRRTYRILIARPRLHSMQHGKN